MGGDCMTYDSSLPPEVAKAVGSGIPVKTHLPDTLRLGVLAQEEAAELRIEGHIMSCPICGESCLCLWEKVRGNDDPPAFAPGPDCARTRSDVFRYLEDDREVPETTLTHLGDCESCRTHFIEPAKALYALLTGEDGVGAQD